MFKICLFYVIFSILLVLSGLRCKVDLDSQPLAVYIVVAMLYLFYLISCLVVAWKITGILAIILNL
ncbi:MAG: hypothetical protein DRG83_00190 [Deltaproteobacteria bacterium]|nr:MAG: hypothetical protein DRG83_00190 [Deltaproteobacteria bacterium]